MQMTHKFSHSPNAGNTVGTGFKPVLCGDGALSRQPGAPTLVIPAAAGIHAP